MMAPPLSAHTAGFSKPSEISRLSVDAQHAVIMDDLLYVLVVRVVFYFLHECIINTDIA